MTDTARRPRHGARLRRAVLLVLATVVVLGPIPVGLVWAWRVHPLLVVPAYLLGIAAWLLLLSGAWSLVRRVVPQRTGQEPGAEAAVPAVQEMPTVRSQVRMPSPRAEATAPQQVS